jgi:hypothetical protein
MANTAALHKTPARLAALFKEEMLLNPLMPAGTAGVRK